MIRKKAAALLAAAIAFSMQVPALAESYTDVPAGHWAAAEIERAGEIGFMSGMGDGTFGLGRNIKRSEFVSMLVRMFGWQEAAGEGFEDVAADSWYCGAVMTAQANGALDMESGYFRPEKNITREEMAVMLVKALGFDSLAAELQNESTPFSDVYENKGYIRLAYEFGIISGRGGGVFDPDGTALREDAASMMIRCYDKYNSFLDFIHGFYAFSSYSQRDLAADMDAVSFGWSRMEYSNEEGVVVNTTAGNDNEWRVPEGYTDIVEYLRDNGVLMNLNVYMSASESDDAEEILLNEDNRREAVETIIDELTVDYRQLGYNPYDGVTIDFENLRGSEMREGFTAFLDELNYELDAIGKSLYVAVQPVISDGAYFDGYDFTAIGQVCDRMIVMAYNYNASSMTAEEMESGFTITPVTPFNEVYYALKTVIDSGTDKDKIVLGLSMSNIGWTTENGVVINEIGSTYSYDDISDMISSGAETLYSERYRNPSLTYSVGTETETVWYENAQSIEDKIELAKMLGIDGISVWRLGLIPDYGGELNIWGTIDELSN